MNPKAKWLQYIEYIPVRIILTIVQLLPYFFAVKVGGWLGGFLYYITPFRKTVFEGLNLVFNDKKSQREIKTIAKKFFKHFGKFVFEFMQLPKLNKDMIERIVKFTPGSLDTLKELFDRQQGIVGITSHFGNWEIMGIAISSLGFKVNHIVRTLDNLLLDKYVEDFRAKFGASIVTREESIKKGFKSIRNKELLTFLIDQNWAIGGIFVPFFGKLAATSKGSAIFCQRFKCPVLAAYTYRNPDNTHSIVLKEIIVDHSITNKEEFIYHTTSAFVKYFEEAILNKPEQWLWLHPRWKSRPKNETKDENDKFTIKYSG